jgi:hypothetical protein
MSDKKIKLNEATEPQLRSFAESYLGMTFPANTKPETIRAKVMAAWTKEEIMVEDEEPKAALTGQPPRTPKGKEPSPDKVRIIIQRTEEAGGDEPVPVGVNGKIMLVPRGEEVEIPVSYFEVLKNAVKDIYEPIKEGGINPVPRKVPSYPFQRLA